MHVAPHLLRLLSACLLFNLARAHDDDWESGGGGDDDDDDATWFERLDVPITFDAAGRYILGVTMSEGTGQQNFSFTFTTSTGATSVAGTGGNLERGSALYNQTASTTAQTISKSSDASLFGEPTNTTVIKETCALNLTGGSLWEYENQTIFVISQIQHNLLQAAFRAQLGNEISGIVGLGTNRNSQPKGQSADPSTYPISFEDSIIGQWLREYKNAQNFTFGLALQPPVNVADVTNAREADSNAVAVSSGASAGVMHLMEPDIRYYNEDSVRWINASVSPAPANSTLPPSDWTIILDGWVFATKDNSLSSKGQIVAQVDPIYTGIYIPQDQAVLIHASIPGAQLNKDLSTLGNFSQAWTVPCDSKVSYGIVVDSQTFTMDETTLVTKTKKGNQCVSAIEAWTDNFQTEYLFGSRFLSTVYLIFSVPRDGPASVGIGSRKGWDESTKSSLDIGAIVGGAVGGAALLILSAFGFWFLRRHWKRTKHIEATLVALPRSDEPKAPVPAYEIEPFTLRSPTSVQYTLMPPQSPASTHHTLSPLPSPGPHVQNNRYSVSVAPPSYVHA